jgi:hypothetical protein
MAIKKIKGLESEFSIFPNSTLNAHLSWGAKGLLAYLCSKPDDWSVSVQQLVNHSKLSVKPTGRDGTYTLINELMAKGYMQRTQNNESGKFSTTDYEVSPLPLTDSPYTVEPLTANPTLQSTELNKVQSNTNILCEESFQIFYSAGLPKKNPQGARKSFSSLIKKIKCDPMELAETLKQDIEYRLSTGEFGFNKLHPATYLNKERWLDEYETAKPSNNGYNQEGRKLSASERIRASNELKYGSQQPSSGLGMAADGGDIREPMDQGEWREALPHVEDRS